MIVIAQDADSYYFFRVMIGNRSIVRSNRYKSKERMEAALEEFRKTVETAEVQDLTI